MGSFIEPIILRNILTEIIVVEIIGRYDALELSDEYLRIRQNDVSFVFDGKKWNRLDLYENIKI